MNETFKLLVSLRQAEFTQDLHGLADTFGITHKSAHEMALFGFEKVFEKLDEREETP